MEHAVSFDSLRVPEFSDVIKRFPDSLLPRGNRLLQRLIDQEQQQRERLESLLATLPEGNAQRGRKAFFSKQSKCSVCHRVAERAARSDPT